MCELRISRRGLHHNIRLVRKVAGDTEIIGVVKGNGYGLGLLELSQALVEHGIRVLAVSELSDALTLRKHGVRAEIMLLTPLYDDQSLETALRNRVILSIGSLQSAIAAERIARQLGGYGYAQLCIDTGFGRYGVSWRESGEAQRAAEQLERVKLVGTYSHLCRGKPAQTEEQGRRFDQMCTSLSQQGIATGMRHIADSYTMLTYPDLRLDAVRIGSAFLGRLPFRDIWGFEQIGTLSAPVQEIRTLEQGSTVGYGGRCVTHHETRIAVVGAGYSHGLGLCREHGTRTGVRAALHLLRRSRSKSGLPYPVLGPVGMNSTVLDVTDADLKIGDHIDIPVNPIYVNSSVPRVYLA